MPARKRVRDVRDVDGNVEIEVESASSSFRMNDQHTKRTRVALAQAADNSVLPDDDEDYLRSETNIIQDGSDSDDSDDVNPNFDYSLRQDSDDDEQEEDINEEAYELAATQFVHRQHKEFRENRAADHGVVEEIYCQNFMCHSNLRIKLGPLINFIIGHNGSGKSAVLTALQICLGTKASETSRAKGLKSLIKTGTDKATVGVTIKNEGENAYKPDLYGRSITVERHFARAGGSGFKLKAAPKVQRDPDNPNKKPHQDTISTKKADLDDMLDYFSLQMDNPISVLTQDKARAFLSNSTPIEKYKFFMKGTQLEILNSDYKLLEENLDNTNAKLDQKEGDIKELKRRLDEAQRRKQQADNSRQLFERMNKNKREWAWAQIEEEEKALARMEEEVVKAKDKLTEAEEVAEAASVQFQSQETAVEAQNRAIAEHESALQPLKEAHEVAKGKWDANKKALLELKTEERTIKEQHKSAKRQLAILTRDIATERERLAEQHGEAHTQRLRELDELKARAQEAKEASQAHEGGLRPLQEAVEAAKQRQADAKEPVEGARQKHNQLKNDLDRLRRNQGNKWAPYPRNMERLCREIDNESRWRKKPVGPMGMFVQINKPQWSSIVESICGQALDAFAVTSKYDQNILDTIASRVGCRVTTYITSDTPIPTTDGEPDAGVDTVMSILRINEDIVRNNLIINQFIEQTVLIENMEEGRAFMYDNGRVRNVTATITMTPGDRRAGSRWTYDRTGEQKMGPVKAWPRGARMQTDREEEIRLLQDSVNDAHRALSQAQQRVTDTQNETVKAQQAVTRHKREQSQLKEAWQRAEDDVEAKQSEIDANQPKDGRLQELQRQEEETLQEKKTAEDSLEDAATQVLELDANARQLKSEVEDAEGEVDKVQNLIDRAMRKKSDVDHTRLEALTKKNAACDSVTWWQAKIVELEKDVDEQKERIARFMPQAQAVAPDRVPVTAHPDVLEERVNRLQSQYEREIAAQEGLPEEVTRRWSEAQKKYLSAKKEVRDAKRLSNVSDEQGLIMHAVLTMLQLLMQTLAERHRRWGLFRGYISMRTRINFSYLLTERNFRGRIEFDHSEKTLDLKIEPDMTKKSDAGRQTKTLSGGEKSYSTICLLLSIWEAMGSPIRCLDEFDVFMDSVNRSQSMKLMIETARRAVGRQFVLITPQSMNSVERYDDVMIHR